jgi:hypothetical protein
MPTHASLLMRISLRFQGSVITEFIGNHDDEFRSEAHATATFTQRNGTKTVKVGRFFAIASEAHLNTSSTRCKRLPKRTPYTLCWYQDVST